MATDQVFMDTYNQLYEQLETMVKEKSLTLTNIVDCVVDLMVLIERISKMSGEEKKKCVISVLKTYLEKNMTEHKELLAFVETTLPPLIDTLISLDKKEIKIHVDKCLKFLCCK